MIGIYKYTNKINGNVYIGQSVDIQQRQYNHKYSAFNESTKDYNSQFHQAIRKYGIDNFDFEIVAEVTKEEYSRAFLNELERFFIKYYDSYHNGYNATEGGDDKIGNSVHIGEANGKALLSEEDVIHIRECYNAHIPFRKVYEEYNHKISKRGLQNVWWFKTWKHILPEYETEENKKWHASQAKALPSNVASNNKRGFTIEEVQKMRLDYDNGLAPKEIWKKYAPDKAWSTVYNVITKQTYKDIK